jgi:hypothetical protein
MVSGVTAIYAYLGRISAYGRARDEIQSQRVRFENGLSPYDSDDALTKFIERIEPLISGAVAEGRAASLKAMSAQDAGGR